MRRLTAALANPCIFASGCLLRLLFSCVNVNFPHPVSLFSCFSNTDFKLHDILVLKILKLKFLTNIYIFIIFITFVFIYLIIYLFYFICFIYY